MFFPPFFVSTIIIIPLIQFPSLARPINFWWHLSEWNKWNDWLPSFVQRVRHYMTYVGSLPYLEPIIWWVGTQPTSTEIRVLKSRGAEEHGRRSPRILAEERCLSGKRVEVKWLWMAIKSQIKKKDKNRAVSWEAQHGRAGVTILGPSRVN